jgi:hypothetical protein
MLSPLEWKNKMEKYKFTPSQIKELSDNDTVKSLIINNSLFTRSCIKTVNKEGVPIKADTFFRNGDIVYVSNKSYVDYLQIVPYQYLNNEGPIIFW